MAERTLEKIRRLNKKIIRCKRVLKSLNSPYTNIIRLNDYDGGRDTTQIINLSSEPELEIYIREYFIHKLEVLESELANLN